MATNNPCENCEDFLLSGVVGQGGGDVLYGELELIELWNVEEDGEEDRREDEGEEVDTRAVAQPAVATSLT